MNKKQYLAALEAALRARRVADVEEVLQDYEAHFTRKALDGYAEEEVSRRLGNPDEVAEDFTLFTPETKKNCGTRGWIRLGLCFADIGALVWLIVLVIGSATLLAAALGLLAFGVYLAAGGSTLPWVPTMPAAGRILMGCTFAALGVLTATGEIWFLAFARQTIRAYGRWHGNRWYGRHELPLPVVPQFVGRARRYLRRAALLSAVGALVLFIAAYIVMSIQARALGFWHVWHWFQ